MYIKENKKVIIAPAFEEEIKRAFQMIYDNRDNLKHSDLRNLFRIGNSKFIR